MIKALAHLCIETTELEKTDWFYCTVLGLTRQFDFIKEGNLFGYYIKINEGNFIEVFERSAAAEQPRPLITHFCLEVDDINQVEEQLNKHGVENWGKKFGADNSWQLWTKDPNGVAIEFHQYTAESCQYTGKNCPVDW